MAKNRKMTPIEQMVCNTALPVEQRLEMVRGLFRDDSPQARSIAASLVESLEAAHSESAYHQAARQFGELVHEIESGPLRPATFIELLRPEGNASSLQLANGRTPADKAVDPAGPILPAAWRVLVILEDGTTACPILTDDSLARALRRGDRVLIDGKGRLLLFRAPMSLVTGEQGVLERRIDDQLVEVTLRGSERHVFFTAEALMEDVKSGRVGPGAPVVVNARQCIAYRAVPSADGYAHYRYLVRTAVPDIQPGRDIGAAPPFIRETAAQIRLEMTQPELRRRYRLPRCTSRLLAGVSGSGKTLALFGTWSEMYRVMSEVTGVPVKELPPRVFRLNLAQVLSMWLGESDKLVDRFFGEIEQLAGEEWTAPDGRKWTLPVMAILEEIDGLAQARGQDSVYDRILTTALQRLDPTRPELRDKLIFYFGTTNQAHQVDHAFLRRIGGRMEYFGRLQGPAFESVVEKHLRGLPLNLSGLSPGQGAERHCVLALRDWLYSQNGSEPRLVELTFAGSTQPVPKFRRDFMTGALVDRAVQQAASEASWNESEGQGQAGVTLEALMRAFDQQVAGIVEQLHEANAHAYLDIPAGARVASLRRLPRPRHLPIELQRQ